MHHFFLQMPYSTVGGFLVCQWNSWGGKVGGRRNDSLSHFCASFACHHFVLLAVLVNSFIFSFQCFLKGEVGRGKMLMCWFAQVIYLFYERSLVPLSDALKSSINFAEESEQRSLRWNFVLVNEITACGSTDLQWNLRVKKKASVILTLSRGNIVKFFGADRFCNSVAVSWLENKRYDIKFCGKELLKKIVTVQLKRRMFRVVFICFLRESMQ